MNRNIKTFRQGPFPSAGGRPAKTASGSCRRAWPLAVSALLALVILLGACNLFPSQQGGKFAFLYGITDFSGYYYSAYPEEGVGDLTYTKNDAVELASLLSERGWQANLRLDDGSETEGFPASRTQLLADLAWAAANCTSADSVLFYFSSHGGQGPALLDGGEPKSADSFEEWIFLWTESADLYYYPSGWIDGAVSDDELGKWLKDIPTKKKMVVIDTCNSGGFIGTHSVYEGLAFWEIGHSNYGFNYPDPFDPDLWEKTVRLYLSFPSMEDRDVPASDAIVLSAAGELEESMESDSIGHGIFTYFLLSAGRVAAGEAYMQGDANRDGYVTVLEAYDFTNAYLLKAYDNSPSYLPRISGSPVDIVLFKQP